MHPLARLNRRWLVALGEPLEDGGLGLGVHGQADRFLHGAVGDGFRDAALFAAGGGGGVILRFGRRGVVVGVRGGRRRGGLQPAVAVWGEKRDKSSQHGLKEAPPPNHNSRNVTFMLHRGVDSQRVRRLYAGFHSNWRIAPQGVFGAGGEEAQVKPTQAGIAGSAGTRFYLTGVKLEKSAQPVSELELVAGEELQPVSAGGGDGGDGATAPAAVDVPVSIGMSSKLAVHTGPGGAKTSRYRWKPL